MKLELRHLRGQYIQEPDIPPDPKKFQELMIIDVGCVDSPESRKFKFMVLTISEIKTLNGGFWGRGILILPDFSWDKLYAWVNSLLANITFNTWEEALFELNKELLFEDEIKKE